MPNAQNPFRREIVSMQELFGHGASRTRTGDLLGAMRDGGALTSGLFSALQSQRVGLMRAPRESPMCVDLPAIGRIRALVPIRA